MNAVQANQVARARVVGLGIGARTPRLRRV